MMLSFESGSHMAVHSVYPFPFLVDLEMGWGYALHAKVGKTIIKSRAIISLVNRSGMLE